MTTVLLVPRRADGGHRDKLWSWCRARWESILPDVSIFEGAHEDGPFNRSAAINTAARLAGDWDTAVVIDADIFIRASQVLQAIETAQRSGRVTWAHRRWRGFHQDHTNRVIHPRNPVDFGPEIDRDDMDVYIEVTNPYSWSCCVVIPRRVWDDMGGFDERFVGWGFEDMAFKSVVQGLYGWERIAGDVYHLWHPRSGERIVKGEPAETASPEYLTNARLGRRYMVAQYREHGWGDEVGERLPVELRAKHVENLKHDDAKLIPFAARYGLPDISGWWPRLEELRDGAKLGTPLGTPASVTVIVHTGGTEETWAERSGYLRRSLASLTEHITGPIVQRVIYTDWGPDNRDELDAIAQSAGFYVVGPQEHKGYTESMRLMWRYLSRNATGDFIFAAEDDFTYPVPVALDPMIQTLRENPHLAQIALLRDSFYQDEQETGGILGWPEPAFTRVGKNGNTRLEHRNFWTANPSLFPKGMTSTPWPSEEQSRRILGRRLDQQANSETAYGKLLLNDARVRFAFWGDRVELTRHIGEVRAGTGY